MVKTSRRKRRPVRSDAPERLSPTEAVRYLDEWAAEVNARLAAQGEAGRIVNAERAAVRYARAAEEANAKLARHRRGGRRLAVKHVPTGRKITDPCELSALVRREVEKVRRDHRNWKAKAVYREAAKRFYVLHGGEWKVPSARWLIAYRRGSGAKIRILHRALLTLGQKATGGASGEEKNDDNRDVPGPA